MDQMLTDKTLNQLLERLRSAYGKDLRSVILYGSGATGDLHGAFSDLNILTVLEKVTPKELEESEAIFKWWREKGNPAPLLMSVAEVQRSADCFPIEFHDISERKQVLHGDDPTAGLVIRDDFYRAQVEHELRAKLLRLRQKAAGVLRDKDLLLRLMCDSAATFCVLGRHALRLAGHSAPWSKSAIVAALQERFGVGGQALDMLIKLREGNARPRDVKAGELFAKYLGELTTLVDAVDSLER
ncbi:MAG: nucleotidyltransferase domain-containing protein [Acidobacteria bacterium]|nr:nucleotidyltransferase domain-containing protein [Acidobacteriota bacterium]